MTSEQFIQQGPKLKNQFASDALFKSCLRHFMPKETYDSIEPELVRFGERVVGEMLEWAWQAETAPPRHIPFSPWGARIDQIEVSPAWTRLNDVAAEEGLIATAYERKQGEHSRLFQFAKLYLFHPSSALYSCPLAMTDGAARILELMGPEDLNKRALTGLLSRDPREFWTSGQWMTEKTGGSDVGPTSTVARRVVGGGFELHGIKWFTSAVTAQMSMALARIEGAQEGSRGLSLFYLETHREDGSLNNIEVMRLKEKLGTRALPTAELRLLGTPARLIGEEGRGVPNIATMLNLTRLHNSICAVAHMRRSMALLKSYADQRLAFGKVLSQHPAFVDTFAREQVVLAGATASILYAALLLGREETGQLSAEEQEVLRILVPLVKLTTAKLCVAQVSEVLEAFGGAGYIEDTRIPVLLRDGQVFAIWEGPTHVLALDVLRVMRKTDAVKALFEQVRRRCDATKGGVMASVGSELWARANGLQLWLDRNKDLDADRWASVARELSFQLWQIHTASLLLGWSLDSSAQLSCTSIGPIASRFIRHEIRPWENLDRFSSAESLTVYNGYA